MITFIHQQSGSRGQNDCLKFFKRIASDLSLDYNIIIADNSIISNISCNRFYKIPSDNQHREFSGWEQARIYGIANNIINGGVILTNDTVLRHHVFDEPRYKSFISAINSCIKSDKPTLVGELHSIKSPPPFINCSKIPYYVPTMYIFLNEPGFKSIDTFIPYVESDRIFNYEKNTESVLLNVTSHPAHRYLRDIEFWLYKKSSSKKWYRHEKLNYKNYERIKLKFYSILIEHQLTQRFVQNGGIIIDTRIYINRTLSQNLKLFFLKVIKYIQMKANYCLNLYKEK